jgi:hypothetical protein
MLRQASRSAKQQGGVMGSRLQERIAAIVLLSIWAWIHR